MISPQRVDATLLGALRISAGLAGVLLLIIFFFMAAESWAGLRDIGPLRFVLDTSWHPEPAAVNGSFRITAMVAATLAATAGAVVLATPLAIGAALFLRFYAPPGLAGPFKRIVELLAGVPSVVYGFWGLVVLVPLLATLGGPGQSLLAGILILTLMILPTITLLAHAALVSVPPAYLQAAAALGMSRWTTIRSVALPAARGGLFTGIVLGTGRAAGETMAVLMVCGNIVQLPDSLLAPVRTLTANIALEMAYALGDHRAALFVSGLVLMLLVTGLVLAVARLDASSGSFRHG